MNGVTARKAGGGTAVADAEDDGGDDVIEGEVADGNLVEAVAEDLGGGPELKGGELKADEDGAGNVEESGEEAAAEALPAGGGVGAGEGDGEVEEQRGLKRGGDDVGPVDDPVEGVELAGVLEGVEDEGDEAEDVEVGGFGGGPAAEQDVDADGQVDHGDEPEAVVDGAVGGLGDDLDFEGALGSAGSHGAEDGVGGVTPDAAAEELADEGFGTGCGVVVDGLEEVAFANACALGWGVVGDTLGEKHAVGFAPHDAVCGGFKAPVAAQIDGGQDAGGKGDDCQGDGKYPGLKVCLHYCAALLLRAMHVACQMNSRGWFR